MTQLEQYYATTDGTDTELAKLTQFISVNNSVNFANTANKIAAECNQLALVQETMMVQVKGEATK